MSHELRTPLNAIRGYADLLDLEIEGPLTNEQRAQLRKIQKSEGHLLALIDDLLELHADRIRAVEVRRARCVAAINHRRGVPARRTTRESQARRAGSEPGRSRVGSGKGRPRKASADSAQPDLERDQVQRRRRKGSSAVLRQSSRRGDIDGRHRRSDTGRGIPEDKLADIFEPFFQVDKGLTRNSDGVGLGLAISRTLARAMSGDVTASSEPGKGSRFVVSVLTAGPQPNQ